MDDITRTDFASIWQERNDVRYEAFMRLLRQTDEPVPWAYDVWDELVERLADRDNHFRAIAAQLLSNLAKSDPQKRMLKDFPALVKVTRDERFVTARHTLQSIWKVGGSGLEQRDMLLDALDIWFTESSSHKNCKLIRSDIIKGLKSLYQEVGDDQVRQRALALIEQEEELKYRKKYAAAWRKG